MGDGSARYDAKVEDEHHHLVCSGCGRMFDVERAGIEEITLSTSQRHGMRVETVEIVFRGRCKDCV